MYQVLQDIRSGDLTVSDVPPPSLISGAVLVRTRASLISPGTERSVVKLASSSLLSKALARPDLAKKVIEKALREGIRQSLWSVNQQLDKPLPLGYSAAGIVEDVASDVHGFRPGDRVAIAGARYATHAEINLVPKNLVARLPENVSFEQAAYTTLATIALQGVRLAGPALGESVAVIGLGLVGLLTVQLLIANGCRVVGVDPVDGRRGLAKDLGAEAVASPAEAESMVDQLSGGYGVDHAIITAATSSNDTVVMAGKVVRRRGTVIVVGSVGMDLPRDDYFKKELKFQVSMSYGPGRYDPSYEEGGIDYPYDYVRWTEGRNMRAVVDLMDQGKLDVDRLTTHKFAIADAVEAYDLVKGADSSAVGIILTYPEGRELVRTMERSTAGAPKPGELGASFIGAGNYAAAMLLPLIQKLDGVRLEGLATVTGGTADRLSDRFGFRYYGTDVERVLSDDRTDILFVATRHSTHADLACSGLGAGKHVFVEKPMVITPEQLDRLTEAESKSAGLVMVGVNRRFSPMVRRVKEEMGGSGGLQIVYRVNSGHIPPDAWVQFEDEGGGMLVGEMIHFVDVMQFLTGERPSTVFAQSLRVGRNTVNERDNVAVTIGFAEGSVGVLAYNTVGDKAVPKERIEVFGGGKVAVIDDFRRLELTKGGRTTRTKSLRQDKGQEAMLESLFTAIRTTGRSPIPFVDLRVGMEVIFAVIESLRSGTAVDV